MKPIFKIILLALVLLWGGSNSLYAQRNEMKVQRLNASDGLVDNSVLCILQDYLGFLWLGTENGLHKYDGYTFKVYQPNPGDPGSIRSRSFGGEPVLYEDANRNLWIGGDGGLHRYLRDSDRFQHYPLQAGAEGDVPYNVVCITGDSAGRLWVNVANRGLYQFDPIRETLASVEKVNSLLGKAGNKMRMTDADRDGIYETHMTFPAYSYGDSLEYKFVVRRANGYLQWEAFPNPTNPPYGNRAIILRGGDIALSPVDFGAPSSSTKDNLIRATGKEAIPTTIHFQVNTKHLIPPLAPGDSLRLMGSLDPLSWEESRQMTSICYESSHALWVGTTNGLFQFDVEADSLLHSYFSSQDPRSISSNNIFTMYRDRQGALWIGTWGGGLNKLVPPSSERLDQTPATFTRYQRDPNDPHSLTDNIIQAIDEDANGELWIVVGGGSNSSSNQLNRFNPQTSRVTWQQRVSSNHLVSVQVDRSGLIWAGTGYDGDGLFKLNSMALKFPHYTMQPDEPNSFYGKNILAICEDRSGDIWLGGEMEGLYRFNRQSGKYTT